MLQQAYGEDCLSGTQCHLWYEAYGTFAPSRKARSRNGKKRWERCIKSGGSTLKVTSLINF